MEPFGLPSAWKGLENHLDYLLEGIGTIDTIVEVGVDRGYSLCQFALKFPNARVVGVDNLSFDTGKESRRSIENYVPNTHPNIELCWMDSAEAAAQFEGEIDVLHIDADHMYDSVKRDFEVWSPKVRSGGVVMFHDTQTFKDHVGKFFAELEGRKVEVPSHSGLGCYYKD